jgi:hypothetical protein
MMRKRITPLSLVFTISILGILLVFSGGPAHAESPVLQVEVTHAAGAAKRVPVAAVLTTETGQPIAAARIIFLVDGERDGEARTDANGRAEWRIRRHLPAGVYTVEALHGDPPEARASTQLVVAPAQLELTVSTANAQVGSPVELAASLATTSGQPLASGSLTFRVDGELEGAVRTDANGQARWRIRRSLPAGAHTVEAVFDGSAPLLPARAARSLTVAPTLLEVRTVPALPGTRFIMDGREFTSDLDGIARIGIDRMGVYSLTVSAGSTIAPGIRSEFAGWGDGIHAPQRNVKIPARGPLEVGFNLYHLINPRFTDSQAVEVDPRRVSSLTLMSSIGQRQTVDRIEPFWIQGSRVVRGPEGLEEREITHAIESVIVDGANVVNRAQQRFTSSVSRDWTVEVLFYAVQFIVRDALFGFPTGSAIHLTYPDGHLQSFPLGADRQVRVDALPRGQYRVGIEGPGLSTTRPFVLSRSQDASLLLISYLDVGVVSGLMFTIAVALLLFGRGAGLRRLIRSRASLPGQAQGEPQGPEKLSLLEEQC